MACKVQIQMYDEKWMELFAHNVANDLIFLVIDYLQEQLRNSYRERNSGIEEEVQIEYKVDHLILFIRSRDSCKNNLSSELYPNLVQLWLKS